MVQRFLSLHHTGTNSRCAQTDRGAQTQAPLGNVIHVHVAKETDTSLAVGSHLQSLSQSPGALKEELQMMKPRY